MAFSAKVVLDSVAPSGKRLTTLELTYPRFIHSEVLTHRDRARNSASSRAIPYPKLLANIQNDPVIPLLFGSEQKGMQTGGEIDRPDLAQLAWLAARDNAVDSANRLAELGVHKSIVNRLLEPWMFITVVMTATEWKNFFRLRCHPDAEIHFQKIAGMARNAIASSTPQALHVGEWHRPYVHAQDEVDVRAVAPKSSLADNEALQSVWIVDTLNKVSAARCARVSYLTHDGTRNFAQDLVLFDRLSTGSGFGHWSPMEHVAQAVQYGDFQSGPFRGWRQFRKQFPLENEKG